MLKEKYSINKQSIWRYQYCDGVLSAKKLIKKLVIEWERINSMHIQIHYLGYKKPGSFGNLIIIYERIESN